MASRPNAPGEFSSSAPSPGPGATPGPSGAPQTPPAGRVTRPRPALLRPFPIVRLAGSVRGSRARIRLLTVRAPRGARVEVRCKGKGKGCPFRVMRVRVPRGLARSGLVRVKRIHGRSLRAGTRLEIRVTGRGRIGKHVAFRFRARRVPLRKDGCLLPGRTRAVSCQG